MFDEISSEIVRALQSNMTGFPKESIRTGTPAPDSKSFPLVSVTSSDFKFEDAGLGGNASVEKELALESFSCDGKITTFKLEGKPERPLVSVEFPPKVPHSEPEEYRMDYSKGVITFREAPKKGKDNLIVKYYSASKAGSIRSIRMNVNYNVDVWSKNEAERDRLTIDVIKAIAISQEDFSTKGMHVKPVEGKNLEATEGIFAKRLVYGVEADLKVKIPAARIERVEVRQTKPE